MTFPLLPSWVEQYFESAFVVDSNGVARLLVTETATAQDGIVTIRGKYGSQTTPNATVVELALPWNVDDASVWAIEAYVTAKGAGVRRRIKVTAIIYGVGAVATLDGAPIVDPLGTGAATATFTVSGSTLRLELTPGAGTPLSWGFEVRAQQL